MYESPIQIGFRDLVTEIDNLVITKTQEVVVEVNKVELIRALNYDRDQYYKGLEEGLRAASTDELLDELKRRLEKNNESI